uniref:Alpha-1,2-Mannosidase n=1 Tax=Strigamia maritima TaxID=126957 RepID=T1IIC1_STRMM
MAAGTMLPTFQRYVNGIPMAPQGRKTLRLREKYIVILVFLTFGTVCFGAIFFLPEFRSASVSFKHIRQAGPDLFLLPPPPADDVGAGDDHVPGGGKLIRHNGPNDVDPHRIEDKARLVLRIEHDVEKERIRNSKNVLERPRVFDEKRNDTLNWGTNFNLRKEEERINDDIKALVTDHPGGSGTQGGEPTDVEVKKKRDKVREILSSDMSVVGDKCEISGERGHSAGIFGRSSVGATIVDGLDTLYIMGLTDAYKQGRDWIAESLEVDNIL